jgi:hypothetical protein
VTRIVGKALYALNQAIAGGAEYPDAEHAIATRMLLTDREIEQLRKAYDTQDERGAA